MNVLHALIHISEPIYLSNDYFRNQSIDCRNILWSIYECYQWMVVWRTILPKFGDEDKVVLCMVDIPSFINIIMLNIYFDYMLIKSLIKTGHRLLYSSSLLKKSSTKSDEIQIHFTIKYLKTPICRNLKQNL